MITTKKILAVALITALIGASLGAAIMHSRDSSRVAETTTTLPDDSTTSRVNYTSDAKYNNAVPSQVPSEFKTSEEQTAYKVGFADGFQSCGENRNLRLSSSGVAYAPYRTRSVRHVYYDYRRSHGRSFWQKHRDKLTLGNRHRRGRLNRWVGRW
jgi:hypothetical protein